MIPYSLIIYTTSLYCTNWEFSHQCFFRSSNSYMTYLVCIIIDIIIFCPASYKKKTLYTTGVTGNTSMTSYGGYVEEFY